MKLQTDLTTATSQYRPLVGLLIVLFIAVFFTHNLHAEDRETPQDLTPSGWLRDTQLLKLGIDRYIAGSGSINVDLMAFPPTAESADELISILVNEIQNTEKPKGYAVNIMDDPDPESSSISDSDSTDPADTASRAIVIDRQNDDLPDVILVASFIQRLDKPVQFSLVTFTDPFHTEEEIKQADTLLLNANMPISPSTQKFHDVLGLESAIGALITSLIDTDGSEPRRATKNDKPATAIESDKRATATHDFLPRGFNNMWFIYNTRNGGSTWSAMTFNDGTVTSDVRGVLESGVAASKKNNPNIWGTGRLSDDGESLIVKFPRWEKEEKYFNSDPSIRISSDFKLDGCWSTKFGGSSLGMFGSGTGTATFSSNKFCFNKNGRFSNDSSMVIAGTGPGSLGTNLSGSQGTYKVDGNVIQLSYGDGRIVNTVFGAYRFGETDGSIPVISIGGAAFVR